MPHKNRFPAVLVPTARGVRARLMTARECERLQGFPDDYTRVPYRGRAAELCAEGPRKKAIGNSMPVPVMRWLGQRIAMVDEQLQVAA
jgi:DNA (cytosine-5)-methyltransferase 1